MSTMGNIVFELGQIVLTLINVYIWVIIIAALLSWVRPDPYNPIVQLLYRITEPSYRLVRRYIPTMLNGIDFTPLVIIIALQILLVILNNLLVAFASAL